MFRETDTLSPAVPAVRANAMAPRGIDGITPDLITKLDQQGRFVAIYIIWVVGETGFMIGTTKSPREMPSQAERFNKKQVDFDLLWTPGQEIADKFVGKVKEEMKAYHAHGSWYDNIKAEKMINALHHMAQLSGFKLRTSSERDAVFQDAWATGMVKAREAQKQIDASPPPSHPSPFPSASSLPLSQVPTNRVVPFPGRPSR